MKTLIYEAQPPHVLIENGEEIQPGAEFTVSDGRAAELIADPNVPVRESESDLRKQTRPQLDKLAAKAGVENPEGLASKDAVITAINEASVSPPSQQPVAIGEGQESNEEA